MEKINIEQVHDVLLNIMKEIHRICVENEIPYYIAGGSMLGAIRHKGFIPWDDDMDICVPREHFNRFIEVMRAKLNKPYIINTYKDCDWIIAGYAKVQDTTTIIDDVSLKCEFDKKPGVNIDVFPIDHCDKTIDWEKVKKWKVMISLKNSNYTPPSKLRAFIRKLATYLAPFLRKKDYYIEKIDNYASEQSGPNLFTVWGRYEKDKEIIPEEYWGTPKLYPYEDTEFYGVEKAHEYLSHLYGDYMQLPPVEKRFVHVENIYRK